MEHSPTSATGNRVGAHAVARDAAGVMKRPLLNRRDVIVVTIIAGGIGTALTALTEKPPGRMLAVEAVLNVIQGLIIAAVVSALFRFVERGPKGK